MPKATDTVTTNYRGTFIDGTEFDSSAKHGGAATFPVNGVIPGWTEALQLMHEGDKWQLVWPLNLAYGAAWRSARHRPECHAGFRYRIVESGSGQRHTGSTGGQSRRLNSKRRYGLLRWPSRPLQPASGWSLAVKTRAFTRIP